MNTADLQRTLACHLLYGLNMSYEEVDETHIRSVRFPDSHEEWEVEVCCHGIGVSITLRNPCPLDAAMRVAKAVVEMLEEKDDGRGLN